MWKQQINATDVPPLLSWQGLQILPGLNAVTGDEGSGKTRLLNQLADALGTQALFLDLRLPEHEQDTPETFWAQLQLRCPSWSPSLQADLTEALQLHSHLGKHLFMLSAGSRRKVALVGLLASGATVTCLDQAYAALDRGSIAVVREFLSDMTAHRTRAWLVADYEADDTLDWRSHIHLG